MRLSGWTLIFPSQKSHSDRLLVNEKGYGFDDINAVTMLPAYLTALYLNLENTGENIIDKITQWKNQFLE